MRIIKQSKAHLTEARMSYGEHWLHVLAIVCALLIHAAIPALYTHWASARISETPEERLLRKGQVHRNVMNYTRYQRVQIAALDVAMYIGVCVIACLLIAGIAALANMYLDWIQ